MKRLSLASAIVGIVSLFAVGASARSLTHKPYRISLNPQVPLLSTAQELYAWSCGPGRTGHFIPVRKFTVSDGHRGTIKAVEGMLATSTDGRAQQVFFWHDRKYAGLASHRAISVVNMKFRPLRGGGMKIGYVFFGGVRSHTVWVMYRWNGHKITRTKRTPCGSCTRMKPARLFG